MKKEVRIALSVVIFISLILLIPFLSSDSDNSVDTKFSKLTHYAEEYETGNINYVQLMVYLSSVRESLNEKLGAVSREEGGILKQKQIESILGESHRETKWVWVEGEEREKKLSESVPEWEKIVFDGKKIQIRLNAFPSIFNKCKRFHFDDRFEDDYEDISRECKDELIYRLHFNVEFKKPEEQLDINGKINEIKTIAEEFNSNPSGSNAERLAKESVNAEKIFESYFRRNQGNCEEKMGDIFGSENRRGKQNMIVNEIDFYSGENFEATMRLEMCDDCEWNWIGMNMWLEGRGRFKHPEIGDLSNDGFDSREEFIRMSTEELKAETGDLISRIMISLEEENFEDAMAFSNRLSMLTDAWNEKANNVWEEIDKTFTSKAESLTEEEMREFHENYGWIKEEQERRKLQENLRKKNYEERKQFYTNLFSEFDKREFYFEQIEFEKRLVEEFKEFGEEICDNNIDDNDNEKTDCEENQCGGKICGKANIEVPYGNETKTEIRDMYCIEKTCQLKEEVPVYGLNASVCGNHVCESGETIGNCAEDCSPCPEYQAINCSGKVIFKGEDKNGCPLEPVCIEEEEFCQTNDDCTQPLCGVSECIFSEYEGTAEENGAGKCQVTELKKCKPSECIEGEEKVNSCKNGDELVVETCIDGLWEKTGVGCEEVKGDLDCTQCGDTCVPMEFAVRAECLEPTYEFKCIEENRECKVFEIQEEEPLVESVPIIPPKPIAGDECIVREDCGNSDDVCSNGKCVTIPKSVKPGEEEEEIEEIEIIEEEIVEEPEEVEENQDEESSETSENTEESSGGLTGNFIFNFFRLLSGRVTGAITGSAVNEGEGIQTNEDNSLTETGGGSNQETSNGGTKTNSAESDEGKGTNSVTEEAPHECPDAGEPPKDLQENCWYKETYDDRGCVSGYEVECGEFDESRGKEVFDEDYKDREREEKWREEGCKERCERECYDMEIRPCVDSCIMDSGCLEKGECRDDKIKECENRCMGEKDISECEDDCHGKCIKGENTFDMEQEGEMEGHKEEKGVFAAGGSCRISSQTQKSGESEGYIWLNGWGEPFDKIQGLKNKYYSGGQAEWCKWDLENLRKERREIEKGFNQDFAEWFFEKYLPSDAEEWEQHMSGIFETYWRNIDNQMQTIGRMNCLGIKELPDYNLINFSYNTEYGSVEYWEELKEVDPKDFMGFENNQEDDTSGGKVMVISPYMRIWVFPPKEFIKFEMKQAMENHEFPGSPEERAKRNNEEGPTDEEREMIKQDEKFMKNLKKITDKYGGKIDANINFVDFAGGETGEEKELVFNIYTQVNEKDIVRMRPMLPEETQEEDVKIEIDFDKIYDMIQTMEKEMRGEEIESPPWEGQRIRPVKKIDEIKDGITMYFKIRSIINSAEITPKSAEKDVMDLFSTFFKMAVSGDKGDKRGPQSEEEMERMSEKGFENKNEEGSKFPFDDRKFVVLPLIKV